MKPTMWDFKCDSLKLITGPINLPSLLAQNAKASHQLRIITYSLPPEIGYIGDLLAGPQQPCIKIIASSACEASKENARKIKGRFAKLQIKLHPKVHTKVLLIEPNIVIVGSANFTSTNWHETCIRMRSRKVHDWYVESEWIKLWKEAKRLDKPVRPEGGFRFP